MGTLADISEVVGGTNRTGSECKLQRAYKSLPNVQKMSAFRTQSELFLSVTILSKHLDISNCLIKCVKFSQDAEYTNDILPFTENK